MVGGVSMNVLYLNKDPNYFLRSFLALLGSYRMREQDTYESRWDTLFFEPYDYLMRAQCEATFIKIMN